MQSLITKAKRIVRKSPLLHDERGLSTVEYVIILVLIAVVAIGVWQAFGGAIMAQVTGATEDINGLGSGSTTDNGAANNGL